MDKFFQSNPAHLSHTNCNLLIKEGGITMMSHDYDAALFYLHRMACGELIHLMTLTKDDFLSKKIEKFVKDFMYEPEFSVVEKSYDSLLSYLDHVFLAEIEEAIQKQSQ